MEEPKFKKGDYVFFNRLNVCKRGLISNVYPHHHSRITYTVAELAEIDYLEIDNRWHISENELTFDVIRMMKYGNYFKHNS